MQVSGETPDKVNGLWPIVVEEADFKADLEKTLKDYRKRANIPGFRPGMAPMAMIKRQIGPQAKMEVINRIVGNEIQKSIAENNIEMLGQPLGSEKQVPVDLDKEAPYTFMFDIAVAPEINLTLSADDKLDYYEINVDDELVGRQVDMFASRSGEYKDVEVYTDGAVLRGDLRELDAEGNTLEGGITVEKAVIMPSYIKVDDQKALFNDAKAGDIITFNPRKAYPNGDAEVTALLKIDKDDVAQHEGDFSYQITQIQHYENHAIDQDLFDKTFGEGEVKSEEEFRAKIAEGLKSQLTSDSNYKLLLDLRKYAEDKVGELTFPETLLRRIMNDNLKDKDAEVDDESYAKAVKELAWSLIRSKIVAQTGVEVDNDDVKAAAREAARVQFAQYGMNNVPAEYIDNYADKMLEKEETVRSLVERATDVKLIAAVKNVVTLEPKAISLDDFNKMMGE